jgi:hypothetical protein
MCDPSTVTAANAMSSTRGSSSSSSTGASRRGVRPPRRVTRSAASTRLACDQCHRRAPSSAPTSAPCCDEHRGQFAGRTCLLPRRAGGNQRPFDHANALAAQRPRWSPAALPFHAPAGPEAVGRQLPGVPCRVRPGVRELSRGRAQGPARQQLRLVPQHFRMEADEDHGLRPRAHGLPAHRTTRGRGVREVPRPGPTAAREARSVRRLPPRRPRRRTGAAGRRGALRELPRRPGVPARPLRCGGPREDGLPVAGGAPRDRVRRVSSAGEWRGRGRASGVALGSGRGGAAQARRHALLRLPPRPARSRRRGGRGNACETCHRVESWREVG